MEVRRLEGAVNVGTVQRSHFERRRTTHSRVMQPGDSKDLQLVDFAARVEASALG